MKRLFLALVLMVPFMLAPTIASLESVEKVADYPVLTVDLYGTAALFPRDAAGVHRLVERFYPAASKKPRDIMCSLVASRNETGGMVYGRNFDWFRSVPIVYRVHRAPGRFASIALVDGSYLSVTGSLSPIDRINALGGYISPFDGMNEKGLFIAIAMVPPQPVPVDPKKPTLTSVQLVRRILDTCATVEEAEEACRSVNIDFFPGPHLHFLVADAAGHGRVIEFNREGVQSYSRDQVLFATNFTMCDRPAESFSGQCWRFDRLSRLLLNGEPVTRTQMMGVLEQVKQHLKQGGTEWSAVYDTSGHLSVCVGMDYTRRYDFNLEP